MTAPADDQIAAWHAGGADLEALHHALTGGGRLADYVLSDLEPLRTKGLVHAHVRIRGAGAVLRIPRLSVFGFEPRENLDYQAECFRRAAPSGHVPKFYGKIDPAPEIPWGALVIEEIAGRPPRVPSDMAAIADALAAIHGLPVPDGAARPPLLSHDDPAAATMEVIERQAAFLPEAGIEARALAQLEDELAWARDFAAASRGEDCPVTLVGTDTHPGNFLIDGDGRAVFVDLEKMLYGAPAIDLAHASVYTSTMWDEDIATALSDDEVTAFYEAYFARVPPDFAARVWPWCAPLRRLTWLRTTTWAAKWKVESRNGAAWSAARHDPAYLDRARARVADFFDPDTIERIRAGFADEP